MDKVVIFGIYHFLGFNLCQEFLEAGIEVQGYRWSEDCIEEHLEEKRLLIGRNANFTEKRLDDFVEEIETSMIVSYYDLYYSKKVNPISLFEQYTALNNRNHHLAKKHIVFLLPIVFVNRMPESLNKHFTDLEQNHVRFQIIYLPTVFGPWQPSAFLFQKYLQANETKMEIELDERELTVDAIYIHDLTKEMAKIMNDHENSQYIIQSTKPNQWYACARYLNLERFISNIPEQNKPKIDERIKLISINESIKIEDGLNKQKVHLKRLLR
ncbi:hypothetical protein [Pseudoneobacillus sp. C159]